MKKKMESIAIEYADDSIICEGRGLECTERIKYKGEGRLVCLLATRLSGSQLHFCSFLLGAQIYLQTLRARIAQLEKLDASAHVPWKTLTPEKSEIKIRLFQI